MSQAAKVRGKRKKPPATAAGQALGYSLQFTRLTAMLLDAAEGSTCSLEVLDDVAEESADGRTKLSQSKSALTSNPVADRAPSLWKALFNWCQLVKGGFVDVSRTIFELYVSRKVGGPLVDAFHQAKTPAEAAAALTKARTELWGEPPRYDERSSLSDAVGQFAIPVLEAEDKLVVPIIMNLQLRCSSGSPQADIEAQIRRGPVSEARVFDIANQMCGWVKRHVDKQLERNLPAFVTQDEFHREYVSYVRRIDRDIILKSLAGKPSDAEQKERLFDTFVRQLDLIEFSFDDKLAAISDFLRASSDRARWSEVGDVHEHSFDELNENLKRVWRNHSRATEIEAASSPAIERGQLLHTRCMNHQAKVQNMEPPAHFVPGCLHALADDTVIGWHPAYRELLRKPVAEAS
jgi:hypothetical protein